MKREVFNICKWQDASLWVFKGILDCSLWHFQHFKDPFPWALKNVFFTIPLYVISIDSFHSLFAFLFFFLLSFYCIVFIGNMYHMIRGIEQKGPKIIHKYFFLERRDSHNTTQRTRHSEQCSMSFSKYIELKKKIKK